MFRFRMSARRRLNVNVNRPLFGSLDVFFRAATTQNGDIRGRRNYVTRRDSMKSRLHARTHARTYARTLHVDAYVRRR